jgi:hypothetical protein
MKITEITLGGHSVFSPSSSEMWLNCSGSLLANLAIRSTEGDGASEVAAEGTVAHEMAEIWLNTGKRPIQYLGDVRTVNGFPIEVTEEMLDYVAEYVNWCNNQEGDKFVEVKVDFSHLTPIPNQKGTSDHVCCSNDKLTITDLKYGMGVTVDAENNTQLQIYALGVLHDFGFLYDFETVEMRICQPRLNHFSTWEISVDELLAFGEYVKERAKATLEPNAERVVTEKGCRWCRVKAQCPAQARYIEELIGDKFDAEEPVSERIANDTYLAKLPEVDELSMKDVEKIYSKIKIVTSFFTEVEKKLLDFALKGGKMHSYKLVNGRKSRKWVDEAHVIELIQQDTVFDLDIFQPRQLVSVAQMEKICKSHKIDFEALKPMVDELSGRPTIAPIDDKRPALSIIDMDSKFDE